MADDGRFFPPLAGLMDEGAGLLIGTSDADGTPRAARGWSARLDGEGRLRVTVSADDPVVVANLADVADRTVAVTTASVRTLRSVQLKGPVVAVTEPDDDDRAAFAAHTDSFFRGIIETDGHAEHLVRRMLPDRCLAVVVDVGAGFDQTPGPHAGAALGSGT